MADFGDQDKPGSNNGVSYEQRVLPETIRQAVDEARQYLSSGLPDALRELPWQAIEYRDYPDLPAINVHLVKDGENKKQSLQVAEKVIQRARAVVQLLGYTKDDLKSFSLYIDPLAKKYNKARAFYVDRGRKLWVKVDKDGFGMDHELGHWATLSVFDEEQAPQSPMLYEGFATWIAWQVKDEAEKTSSSPENYLEFVNKMKKDGVWRLLFPDGNISIDANLEPWLAKYAGAVLFDVLIEKCNGKVKKLAQLWKTADHFPKPSEWIESIGFSSQEVEAEWKNKME